MWPDRWMMLLWNQKMPEAGPSFPPGGHGKWLFPENPCQGTIPPSDCSCSCTMYHQVIKSDWRHWPNLWEKNPKHSSRSCGGVWWKCNNSPYFRGKLVSVCFLQNKSNVHATKNALPNPLFVVCVISKSKATGAGNIYSRPWTFWSLKCH